MCETTALRATVSEERTSEGEGIGITFAEEVKFNPGDKLLIERDSNGDIHMWKVLTWISRFG